MARNLAVESSAGEYLWLLDSDDEIAHRSVKLIHKITDEENYGLILFDTNVLFNTSELK